MVKKTGGKKDLCVKDQEQLRVKKGECGKIKIEIELPEEDLKFLEIISKIKDLEVNNLILQLIQDSVEIYKGEISLSF